MDSLSPLTTFSPVNTQPSAQHYITEEKGGRRNLPCHPDLGRPGDIIFHFKCKYSPVNHS